MMKKYYEAYDERYRAVHGMGMRWSLDIQTPVVLDSIKKYCKSNDAVLEIGCGEGRDAKAVLSYGCDLTAADISPDAIKFCKKEMPESKDRFIVLDCINGRLDKKFDFIYSAAVIHMLTEDRDREGFYRFISDHLNDGGHALVCSMGDGVREVCTDPDEAYEIKERDHFGQTVKVVSTSCRTVSEKTFKYEAEKAGFAVVEYGITHIPPEFDSLMYTVLAKTAHDKKS